MWEVWTRRLQRPGIVSHWNFPGALCSTGMSAVVGWRPRNSSFSWISAFQCSHQTSRINATRISHPKDNLKSTFSKIHSLMSSISISDKYYNTMYLVHSGTSKIFFTCACFNNIVNLLTRHSKMIKKIIFFYFTVGILIHFGNIQYLIFDWYVCLINLTNYRPLFLDWF